MSKSWQAGACPGWTVIRARILRRDNNTCQLALPGCTTHAAHVDHIVPKSQGGTDYPSNLRAACAACNCSRGDGTAHHDPEPAPRTTW